MSAATPASERLLTPPDVDEVVAFVAKMSAGSVLRGPGWEDQVLPGDDQLVLIAVSVSAERLCRREDESADKREVVDRLSQAIMDAAGGPRAWAMTG